jgi:hypothetical protein
MCKECAIPVTPEETERPIFLHEGECTLVANVHVVERMFLLCPVALVDETHVHCCHHVGCKAEHSLLSTVLCIKMLDSNSSQTTIDIYVKCNITVG